MSSAGYSDPDLTAFSIDELPTLKRGTLRLLVSQRSLPYRQDTTRRTLVALLEDWAKLHPEAFSGAEGETLSLNSSRPLEGHRWFQIPSSPQFSIFETRRSMFPSTGLLFVPVSEIVHVSRSQRQRQHRCTPADDSSSSDVATTTTTTTTTISLRSVFVVRQLRRWSRGFGLVSPAAEDGAGEGTRSSSRKKAPDRHSRSRGWGSSARSASASSASSSSSSSASASSVSDFDVGGCPVKWRIVVVGCEKGSFGSDRHHRDRDRERSRASGSGSGIAESSIEGENRLRSESESESDREILERIATGFSDVGIPIVCVCVNENETSVSASESAESGSASVSVDGPSFDFFELLSLVLQINCHPGGVVREGVLTPSADSCVAVCSSSRSRRGRSRPSFSARVHSSIVSSGIAIRCFIPRKLDFWRRDWKRSLEDRAVPEVRRRWCDDCQEFHEEEKRKVKKTAVWKEVVLGEKEEIGEAVSGPFGVRKERSHREKPRRKVRSAKASSRRPATVSDVDVEEEEGELDLEERQPASEDVGKRRDVFGGVPRLPVFAEPTSQGSSEFADDFGQIRDEWENFFTKDDDAPASVAAPAFVAAPAAESAESSSPSDAVDTSKLLPAEVFHFDTPADSSPPDGSDWAQGASDVSFFPPVETAVFDQAFSFIRILYPADLRMHPFMTFLKTLRPNVEVAIRDSGGLTILAHSEALYRLPYFASFWDNFIYGPEMETEGEGDHESESCHFGEAVARFVFPPEIDMFAARAIVDFCYGDFHQCAACPNPGKLLGLVHRLPFPEMELVLSSLVLLTDDNLVDVYKMAVDMELDLLANRCAELLRSNSHLESVATLDQALILRVLRSPEFPVSEKDATTLPGSQISDFVKRIPNIGSLFDVEIHTAESSVVLSSHMFSFLSPRICEFLDSAIPDALRMDRPKPAYALSLPSGLNILPYQLRALCAIVMQGFVPKDWPATFVCSILCAASDLEMASLKAELYRLVAPSISVPYRPNFAGLFVRVLQYCGYFDDNDPRTANAKFLTSTFANWSPEKLFELLYVLRGPKKNLINFQGFQVPVDFQDPEERQLGMSLAAAVKLLEHPAPAPEAEAERDRGASPSPDTPAPLGAALEAASFYKSGTGVPGYFAELPRSRNHAPSNVEPEDDDDLFRLDES